MTATWFEMQIISIFKPRRGVKARQSLTRRGLATVNLKLFVDAAISPRSGTERWHGAIYRQLDESAVRS